MLLHEDIPRDAMLRLIRSNSISFAGNRRLKIYGDLHCKSGKRMKIKNRVFFSSEEEAKTFDYRPCGHCMRSAYQQFKNEFI